MVSFVERLASERFRRLFRLSLFGSAGDQFLLQPFEVVQREPGFVHPLVQCDWLACADMTRSRKERDFQSMAHTFSVGNHTLSNLLF